MDDALYYITKKDWTFPLPKEVLMDLAKKSVLLVAVLVCFAGIATAAERMVIAEQVTSTT
jgi:hypothetical protein